MKAVWFFAFPTTTTTSLLFRSSLSILRSSTGNISNSNSISSSSSSLSAMSTSTSSKTFVVDEFCFRQFSEHEKASKGYGGTVFTKQTVQEFEDIVNKKFHVAGLRFI